VIIKIFERFCCDVQDEQRMNILHELQHWLLWVINSVSSVSQYRMACRLHSAFSDQQLLKYG